MERIVGIEDKFNYTRVYFETFKCLICGNLPIEFTSCKKCHSIYCAKCPLEHSDLRHAILSNLVPSCIMCLNKLEVPSELPEEHRGVCNFDRNLKKILNQDIKVECHFADTDGCSMKKESHERITAHQAECRPCGECLYLCPEVLKGKCRCNKYYKHDKIEAHIDSIKRSAQRVEERKSQIVQHNNAQAEPLLPNVDRPAVAANPNRQRRCRRLRNCLGAVFKPLDQYLTKVDTSLKFLFNGYNIRLKFLSLLLDSALSCGFFYFSFMSWFEYQEKREAAPAAFPFSNPDLNKRIETFLFVFNVILAPLIILFVSVAYISLIVTYPAGDMKYRPHVFLGRKARCCKWNLYSKG